MLLINVPISDAHEDALEKCVLGTASDAHRHMAWTWICLVRKELLSAWEALPDGNHLKMHLADVVWSWSDEDLYGMKPIADQHSEVGMFGEELEEFRKQLDAEKAAKADTEA